MIKATNSERALVINILCDSFDTNKSVNYVVKQDKSRKKRLRKLMEYSFDLCNMFGQVYLSENKDACALILFPDQKTTSFKTIMLDIKLAIACIGLARVSKVMDRDSKIKNEYPKNYIVNLWFIGVKTNEQGKGIGGELLKELISYSDARKRPIYLETSTFENIRFYEKHGFNIYNELDFGYKLFLLRRNLN